jgi:thiol-disulfide isomerase/thioredoxin
MSTSLPVALVVIGLAISVAVLVGLLLNRRSGVLVDRSDLPAIDPADLGLSPTGPTVVHFTADWCGPCKTVRRVVHQVCNDLPEVAHVEIDMDANPSAARRLSVLSLPTTFIFDADGRPRYRATGVPKAADLRSALVPLLA